MSFKGQFIRHVAPNFASAGRGNNELTCGRPCRKCGLPPMLVSVVIPADLSFTDKDRRAEVPIDACIADIVRRLNIGETEPITRGSCCGHGEEPGSIVLQDGRCLALECC